MNNLLAITGSKEIIDQITESIVSKGVLKFALDCQVQIDQISDDCSVVRNSIITSTGSLSAFERTNDSSIKIQIAEMGPGCAATIGLAMGIASHFDGVRVDHHFFKKNKPFIGGYFIERRKLEGFYCWQTNSEICTALTNFIATNVLCEHDQTKSLPKYIQFISREQRAGICHDYFEDSYAVNMGETGTFYLRVSREDAAGRDLSSESSASLSLIIGDITWSSTEDSIIEGMLHEFIESSPTRFYQSFVCPDFSHAAYLEIKRSSLWGC